MFNRFYTCLELFKVYANVQAFDEPYRVDFNISDEKKWRPFFGSKFRAPPSPLASVQVRDAFQNNKRLTTVMENFVNQLIKKYKSMLVLFETMVHGVIFYGVLLKWGKIVL